MKNRKQTHNDKKSQADSTLTNVASLSEMSRTQALLILGLDPGADDHQIDNRLWQLTKRYRAQNDQDALARLSLAYQVASRRGDETKAKTQKRLLSSEYFGKTKDEWINHFRYDWWKYVLAVVVAVVLFFLVSQIAFDKSYDIIPTRPSERVTMMYHAGYGYIPPGGYPFPPYLDHT